MRTTFIGVDTVAVRDCPPPEIIAMIEVFGDELVDQVTVSSMEFDAVEPCGTGPLCSGSETGNGLLNVRLAHGVRRQIGAFPAVKPKHLTLGCHGRGCRRLIDETIALGLSSAVHQLGHERCPLRLNGLDNRLLCFLLCQVGQARLIVIALAEAFVGVDTLCDQQTETTAGEALIVFSHALCGTTIGLGASASHGGQYEPVGHAVT